MEKRAQARPHEGAHPACSRRLGVGGALAVAAVLGPPATKQAVTSLVELRHEVLMLDRELDRVSLRFVALGRGSTERVDEQLEHGA